MEFLLPILIIGLLILAAIVLIVVSQYKIYQKAGRKGWECLIPFYSTAVLLEIVSKPLWWIILLMFVPLVKTILWIVVMRRLAATFGKDAWFTAGLVILPFIFMPILAFGNVEYKNNYEPAKPMTESTKWSLFAAVLFMVLFTSIYTSLVLAAPVTNQ
jgi:Family of unknown function (DUF5684)